MLILTLIAELAIRQASLYEAYVQRLLREHRNEMIIIASNLAGFKAPSYAVVMTVL